MTEAQQQEARVGQLTIDGTLDTDQLWPGGGSDANTLQLQVREVAFDGRATRAFDGAYVVCHGEELLVLQQGEVAVRLQGVDAPELHYATAVPGGRNERYRQSLGGCSTLVLAEWLRARGGGRSVLECRVQSALESPQDAFDARGRLVADVLVGGTSVGHWLVEHGHAFPGLYDSMSVPELQALLAAAKVAREHHDPVWKKYTDELTFDPTAVLQPWPRPRDDEARLVHPKLFRRLARWYASRGDVLNLKSYLAESGELVYRTHEVLEGVRGNPEPLASFIDTRVHPSRLTREPEALVFMEAPSQLRGPGGALVEGW